MSHIHIALVGRETSPVFKVIDILHPDKIFLICSEGQSGTSQEADNVIAQLHTRECQTSKKIFDAIDVREIYSSIEELCAEISDDDYLSINLTGGTKFWALAFYKKFADRRNTNMFLISQNNTLCNVMTNECVDFTALDLDTLIALYGNSMYFKKFEDYNSDDDIAVRQIENIRKFNYPVFNKLAANLRDSYRHELQYKGSGEFGDEFGNSILWSKPDFVDVVLKKKNGTSLMERILSPNAVSLFFNSGWFEYKVAKMISGWDKAREIRLNCRFPMKSGMPSSDKNEVDIIVATDIKPIFIECKTQTEDSTVIDKFATVVDNYGGSACKALFITDQKLKNDIIPSKCKDLDIVTYCLAEHTDIKDLYAILDGILMESNK